MQNTTIPVVMLHVADTGGVTWLAVPLHLSSWITHGDTSHTPKLSTLPHSSHAFPWLSAVSWGLAKKPFTPQCWELSNFSLRVSPPPFFPSLHCKGAAHTGPSPHSGGSRCVGSWEKGRWTEQLCREQPVAFLFLPSSAYHNSIPGKDHFGSPAPPSVAERCSRVLQLGHSG